MSKERPFEDIKPVAKFNTANASREELIAYTERITGQLKSVNDMILGWIERSKNLIGSGDLISRSKLKDTFVTGCSSVTTYNYQPVVSLEGILATIDAAQPEDAHVLEELRPEGCWIRFKEFENGYIHIKCSKCGQYWSIADHDKIFKYCFNCGATMRRDDNGQSSVNNN